MTIEIKQLVIRATAERSRASTETGLASRPSVAASARDERGIPGGDLDHETLVSACVREVLRELRRARER